MPSDEPLPQHKPAAETEDGFSPRLLLLLAIAITLGLHLFVTAEWILGPLRRDTSAKASGFAGAHLQEDDYQDEDGAAAAAVDEILASRKERRIQKPLADLAIPAAGGVCVGQLPAAPPGGCDEVAVEEALRGAFRDASGFWAGGTEEASVLSSAAATAGGPPAICAEATYGEITVSGLHSVLRALRPAPGPGVPPGRPWDVFIDLGAGPGRTAAAAALLGFSERAIGVELGPQRFALGCRALNSSNPEAPPACGAGAEPPGQGSTLELLQGDMREWPQLLAASPEGGRRKGACGPRWLLYLGAKCFRDTLLLGAMQTITRACSAGATVAILGRHLPANAVAPEGDLLLSEAGSVHAQTTWSPAGDEQVFFYTVRRK